MQGSRGAKSPANKIVYLIGEKDTSLGAEIHHVLRDIE